ncbi:unnamed protein product [Linum trigynum]|uniref:Uncharacterized protein n=1 Tax=Linum trigynum TaxID=586398 RepID=A0AAV2E6E1_9ROSI
MLQPGRLDWGTGTPVVRKAILISRWTTTRGGSARHLLFRGGSDWGERGGGVEVTITRDHHFPFRKMDGVCLRMPHFRYGRE